MSTGVGHPQTVNQAKCTVEKLLGIKATSTVQLVQTIERGFSFAVLEKLHKETELPLERLAAVAGISPRTLSRRKKERRLSRVESDRLVSISRLVAAAVELFDGSRDKAVRWLLAPNRALGGASPLEMAATETGAREVESLVGRLEYGVFS